MTALHIVGRSGDKEMATFLFESGELESEEIIGSSYMLFVAITSQHASLAADFLNS